MSNKERKVTFSDIDRAIVNALKEGDKTLAEIKDFTGLDVKPGHVVSAMKKGLIAKNGEREVIRPSIRKVGTYVFNTLEVGTRADGKPSEYNEKETAILNFLSTNDNAFTLAELADAMGLEKIASGTIVSLMRKGNVVKGEDKEVEGTSKSKVGVYTFVADIPADAE